MSFLIKCKKKERTMETQEKKKNSIYFNLKKKFFFS